MNKQIILSLMVVASVLTGCANIPLAPPAVDLEAKKFAVEQNKASIYIYRNESFGGAVPVTVSINDQLLGKTGAKTFFALKVPPGTYTLTSKSENESRYIIEAEAGKNYFIWQEMKMGLLYARNILQQVDEARGRAGVSECQLIEARLNF